MINDRESPAPAGLSLIHYYGPDLTLTTSNDLFT
jgi:hypothetical protein